MDLTFDPIAIQHLARRGQCGQRQVKGMPQDVTRLIVRERLDPDDLDRQVILAPFVKRLQHNGSGGRVEVAAVRGDGTGYELRARMRIHTIRRHDEGVTGLHRQRPVVDLDVAVHAHRTGQERVRWRDDEPMVVGQLLQRTARHPVDSAVARMKKVSGSRLEYQAGKGADIALVSVVGPLTASRLGMEP